jgi:hypothetical protein
MAARAFTKSEVRDIRRLLDSDPTLTLKEVASTLGVSNSVISYIARGITYANMYPRCCKVWNGNRGAAPPWKVREDIRHRNHGNYAPMAGPVEEIQTALTYDPHPMGYDSREEAMVAAAEHDKDTPQSIALEVMAHHKVPSTTHPKIYVDGNFTTCVLSDKTGTVGVGTTKRNPKLDEWSVEEAVRRSVGRACKSVDFLPLQEL